jgi:hypothetical protein
MGMLLTLFGTPFFVSLGFAGLVHVLVKRCARRGAALLRARPAHARS